MCYNIAFLTKRLEIYASRYKEALPPDYLSTVNSESSLPEYFFVSGFDFPELPLITQSGIINCRWGLIPFWTRDAANASDIRSKTLNAAGETVFEKPSFRQSIQSQRALLGVNGFYEWREFNKKKYAYFITLKNDSIFSLGCLFDNWTDKNTGEVFQTFSILTTPANPMMETIHNVKKRMPLIIDRKLEKDWISADLPQKDVASLIKPFNDKGMQAITVSAMVNSVKNDRNTPHAMQNFEYPELNLLFG